MKVAVYARYGPDVVVQIKDVEKPVPKDNEVLIEVRAACPSLWEQKPSLLGGSHKWCLTS
jgi:hypothetical protein